MIMKDRAKLRAGDWVEVKAPHEIAQTLDAAGTLDGLPFMPEMLDYCSRRFRLLRKVEKTCVEDANIIAHHCEFPNNDVVILDGDLRCSGRDHGGCQRACTFFWKAAWLRRVGEDSEVAAEPDPGEGNLRSKLKTKTAPDRYFCQSTALAEATKPLPRWGRLLKCWNEVRFGAPGPFKMVAMIVAPHWRKYKGRLFGDRRLSGTSTRTPTEKLELQPGETVVIKSPEEIAQTLDPMGRNRGLDCDFILARKYAGREFKVRNRVERIILEGTGEMRELNNSVILEGVCCECSFVTGGCPRKETTYWREIWLRRAQKNGDRPAERPQRTKPIEIAESALVRSSTQAS